MAPGKLVLGKEALEEYSLATVKSVDEAKGKFNGVPSRWGCSARRTASQILENQARGRSEGTEWRGMVSCGLLLASALISSHQNALLIEYGPSLTAMVDEWLTDSQATTDELFTSSSPRKVYDERKLAIDTDRLNSQTFATL